MTLATMPAVKTLDQIASELQGYDPNALSADGVLEFLSKLIIPVQDVIELPLFEALGRVLAEDVVSPFDVPPHDNSAMDGYAFDAGQLMPDEALALQLVGTALAGKAWTGSGNNVLAGQCVKIMTGAIMPDGTDTVVPQEFVSCKGDVITIPAGLLKCGDNRRLRGEDLRQDKPALLKGELVTPARLGLAASLGLAALRCFRPIRLAYFSTGDELLSLGERPREGAVYDSNRYTVFGMLRRMGVEVIDMGVVRDDPALLEEAFLSAAERADAIITSGGVSVGEADHTKAMMKKLGDVAFWRIAMRPGRPMAVGRLVHVKTPRSTDFELKNCAESASRPITKNARSYENNSTQTVQNPGAVLFGLPGNPVAVMVTFLAFVRPALLQLMGANAVPAPLLKARSLEAIRKKTGRTEYQRAWVSTAADGSPQVKTTGNQGSGVLRSMAEANGLIVLHHAQGNIAQGDEVDVLMFDGVM